MGDKDHIIIIIIIEEDPHLYIIREEMSFRLLLLTLTMQSNMDLKLLPQFPLHHNSLLNNSLLLLLIIPFLSRVSLPRINLFLNQQT